jgi:hypothetical protein
VPSPLAYHPPLRLNQRVTKWWILYIAVITAIFLPLSGMMAFFFVAIFTVNLFVAQESEYTGWELTDAQLILRRCDSFGRIEQKPIALVGISHLEYIERRPRRPRRLELHTQQGRATLYLQPKPFELGPFFRALYAHCPHFSFRESDAELQLYITGRIDELPMSNSTPIHPPSTPKR